MTNYILRDEARTRSSLIEMTTTTTVQSRKNDGQNKKSEKGITRGT